MQIILFNSSFKNLFNIINIFHKIYEKLNVTNKYSKTIFFVHYLFSHKYHPFNSLMGKLYQIFENFNIINLLKYVSND